MNIVLDTETTGLTAPIKPVEVAWIIFDDSLTVIDEAVHLVNPQRAIEDGAMNIHGITQDQVRSAPAASQVMSYLPKADKLIVVGHNIQFDLRVVGEHMENISADICTLALSRRWIKGTTNHKLPTLKKELGLSQQDSHSALGDCRTSLELLGRCMELAGRDFPALVELESVPKMLTRMPFGKHMGKLFTEVPRGYLLWMKELPHLHKDLIYTLDRMTV